MVLAMRVLEKPKQKMADVNKIPYVAPLIGNSVDSQL